MSNQDKTNVIGHVLYPYNPIIKEIFLKESIANQKDVYFNGKHLATQQISKELRAFLAPKGFGFVNSNKKHLVGRGKVFGVKISVSKIYKGKDIKEIMITIPAKSSEELVKLKEILISGVSSITDIKCKTATSEKFVRC